MRPFTKVRRLTKPGSSSLRYLGRVLCWGNVGGDRMVGLLSEVVCFLGGTLVDQVLGPIGPRIRAHVYLPTVDGGNQAPVDPSFPIFCTSHDLQDWIATNSTTNFELYHTCFSDDVTCIYFSLLNGEARFCSQSLASSSCGTLRVWRQNDFFIECQGFPKSTRSNSFEASHTLQLKLQYLDIASYFGNH